MHLNGAARASAFYGTAICLRLAFAEYIVFDCNALCRVHIAGAIFDSARVHIHVRALLEGGGGPVSTVGTVCTACTAAILAARAAVVAPTIVVVVAVVGVSEWLWRCGGWCFVGVSEWWWWRCSGCRSAVAREAVAAVVKIGAALTHTIGAVVANAVVNTRGVGEPARVVVRGRRRRRLRAQTGGRNIILETAVVVSDIVSVVIVYHRDSAVVPRAIAQPVSLDALSDNVCDRDAGIRLHSDAECGGGGSSGAEAGGERGLQRGGRGGGRDRNRGGDDHAGSCYADGYRSSINASVGGDRASEGGAPDDRGGSGDGGGGLAAYWYGGGGDAYQYGGGGALRHADDIPTTSGFSPSQEARASHTVGDAPQAELVPRQQSGATSHATDLNGVVEPVEVAASHAAASI
eukprot:scaffold133272_cov62-Phaeocystis_antarctica.AAC.2